MSLLSEQVSLGLEQLLYFREQVIMSLYLSPFSPFLILDRGETDEMG